MGKQIVCIWDDDVAECFELFGGWRTAAYFEAIRYRQQLYKDRFFPMRAVDISNRTGLSYYHQKLAREVLEGTGWIETRKTMAGTTGSVLHFRLTELAFDAIKKTKRRRNTAGLRRKLVNSFGNNYSNRRQVST